MHGIRIRQAARDEGVAAFVVGDAQFFLLVDDPRLLLEPRDDALDPLLEFRHGHEVLISPCRQQGRLVHEVRQVGADETRRQFGDPLQFDLVVHLDPGGVHLEDGFAPFDVGPVDEDVAVESPGPQQGRIERLGTVRGAHHDHALIGGKAVHLHQKRVERLLPLIVAARCPAATDFAQRVEFVDEDDAGRAAAGLMEHVPHAGGADADVHFNEIRTREAEKRDARLSRDGLRQERFSRSRGADQEHAAGDSAPQSLVFTGRPQEFDDLAELVDRLVDTRGIAEGDIDVFLRVKPAAAAPK